MTFNEQWPSLGARFSGAHVGRVASLRLELMKKQLISFVAGIILGGAAIILYLVAAGKLWAPAPEEVSVQTADTHTHVPDADYPMPAPAPPSNFATNSATLAQGSPAPPTTETAKASDSLGTQSVPIQYLPPALQQALQQYQKTDDLDARKSLLNDVVSTADDDTSKQEAVQVLGKMFQGENSVELKLEILEDLVLISHPSTIVPLVDAIDPSQPTEVRVTAAQALGSLGDKRAIPFLEQALSDPDPEVQQAARDALDTLRPE